MTVSKKRLKEIEAIQDEGRDFSDILETDEDFWRNAVLRIPLHDPLLNEKTDAARKALPKVDSGKKRHG